MAKTSGGVRTYRQGTSTYQKRKAEAEDRRASGRYSSVEFRDSGGYVAIEKSPARHKPDELEAARILANKGYKVILKNEAGLGMNIRTPDGYLFKASFEQRTPQGSSANNVKNALEHARNKRADIALIYDKYRMYNRKGIEEGVRRYESHNTYRFKQVIVISANGNVHRHKHNI